MNIVLSKEFLECLKAFSIKTINNIGAIFVSLPSISTMSVVIGATGFVGQNVVVEELSNRGHEILAIVRDTSRVQKKENIITRNVDVNDVAAIESAVKGYDVVVSAFTKSCSFF